MARHAPDDTDLGGSDAAFPLTRHSAVVALRDGDAAARARAWDVLVASYWKPVYKYVRLKWRTDNEQAKDLVQGFFSIAIEKDYFRTYDPARAAFRTFLRTCLDHYVANEHRSAARQKRGGGRMTRSLDFDDADREYRQHEPAAGEDVEAYFQREWVRSLFEQSVAALREHCRKRGQAAHLALFERCDLADDDPRPTYAALAAELGLRETQVTNYLHTTRQAFRHILLERLRAITASEAEFEQEARALLGRTP